MHLIISHLVVCGKLSVDCNMKKAWADDDDEEPEAAQPEPVIEPEAAPRPARGPGAVSESSYPPLGERPPAAPRDVGGGSGGGRGSGGGGRGGDYGGGPPSAPRSTVPAVVPNEPPFIAFVGNLDFNATENDVGDFFYSGKCDVVNVVIHMDPDGRSRGFAHVEFADKISLEYALTANGMAWMGRELKVDVQEKKQSGYRSAGGGGGGDFGGGRGGGARDDYRGSSGGAADEASVWERKAPVPLPPAPERGQATMSARREGNMGARDPMVGRDMGRDGGDSGPMRGSMSRATAPTTRPVFAIQPRTKPIEAIGKPEAAASSIFGEGKPADANAYEEAAKKRKAEKDAAEAAEKAARAAAAAKAKAEAQAAAAKKAEEAAALAAAAAAAAAANPPVAPIAAAAASDASGGKKVDSAEPQPSSASVPVVAVRGVFGSGKGTSETPRFGSGRGRGGGGGGGGRGGEGAREGGRDGGGRTGRGAAGRGPPAVQGGSGSPIREPSKPVKVEPVEDGVTWERKKLDGPKGKGFNLAPDAASPRRKEAPSGGEKKARPPRTDKPAAAAAPAAAGAAAPAAAGAAGPAAAAAAGPAAAAAAPAAAAPASL